MSFSCIDETKKRLFLVQVLTAMYNVSNCALYFESPNEFGEHYGLIQHRLSEFSKDNPAQIVLFSAIIAFVAVLAYSNQKSYAHHIDKAMGQGKQVSRHERDPLLYSPTPKPKPRRFDLVAHFFSGLYKSAVATSSLAALLKNTLGSEWAISASIICPPGNFASQFAVFVAPVVKKYHLHIHNEWGRFWLAHGLTFFYNISNIALYFNAGDEFLHHIRAIDHRLIDHRESWAYIPLTILAVGSLFLFLSTQRSYSKKIEDIFTDPKTEEDFNYLQAEYNCWQEFHNRAQSFFWFEAYVTATYKAAINYISLVGALYTFTNSLIAGFTVATLFFAGNWCAQYSILKPEPSPLEKENALLEGTDSSSSFLCRFFQEPQERSPTVFMSPISNTPFSNLINP